MIPEKLMDEGVVKFQCSWEKGYPLPYFMLYELQYWRQKLYDKRLIGAYNSRIGYGNISKRIEGNKFAISGTGTGTVRQVANRHFTLVTGFDIASNRVEAKGPIAPSSESMTHAAIYSHSKKVNAVVHIHSFALWKTLKGRCATITERYQYGTPEMALAVQRAIDWLPCNEYGLLVLAGHREGIVTFGGSVAEAASIALEELERLNF